MRWVIGFDTWGKGGFAQGHVLGICGSWVLCLSDEKLKPMLSLSARGFVCKFLALETGAQPPSGRSQVYLQHDWCSESSPRRSVSLAYNSEESLWILSSEGFSYAVFVHSGETRKLYNSCNAGSLMKMYIPFLIWWTPVPAYLYLQGDADRVNYEERHSETLSEGSSRLLTSSAWWQGSLCDSLLWCTPKPKCIGRSHHCSFLPPSFCFPFLLHLVARLAYRETGHQGIQQEAVFILCWHRLGGLTPEHRGASSASPPLPSPLITYYSHCLPCMEKYILSRYFIL